jgi:hypothetical protein
MTEHQHGEETHAQLTQIAVFAEKKLSPRTAVFMMHDICFCFASLFN